MVQSFNSTAITYLLRVLSNKSLVIPHFSVQDISYISFVKLKEHGIKGIVFDKDNTLTTPYAHSIYPPLLTAFKQCVSEFGSKVCIFSNSAGSADDKLYKNAQQIEIDLGIHVIRHKEKKPGGIEDVLGYLQCNPQEIVAIGDRYFTDILFGNLYGMLTIFTSPITSEGDNPVVRVLRPIERQLVESWTKQQIKPPPHSLAEVEDIVFFHKRDS